MDIVFGQAIGVLLARDDVSSLQNKGIYSREASTEDYECVVKKAGNRESLVSFGP